MTQEELLEKGRELSNQGKNAEALQCAEELTRQYPDFASGWNLIGVIYETMGKESDASMQREELWQQTRALYDKAIACYRRAVELEPDMTRAWKNLGRVYRTSLMTDKSYSSRRYIDEEKSLECCRKALELDKTEENYRSVLERVGGDEYRALLREWAEVDPLNPNPLWELGASYSNKGQYDQAVGLLDRSLAVRETGMAHYYKVYCFIGSDRLEEAEAALAAIDEKNKALFGYEYGQMYTDYMDELRGRIRKMRKMAEKAEALAQPKTVEKTKLMYAIEDNYAKLWEKVAEIPAELATKLPVTPDEVREAIDALDDAAIVSQFRYELEECLAGLENPAGYAALALEWYYAGEDSYDPYTSGYVAGECVVEDNTNPVRSPKMKGTSGDLYGLNVGLVMDKWYTELCPRMDEAEEDMPAELRSCRAAELYNGIFKYKLFILASQAYAMLDEKPAYFFLEDHDHAPGAMVGSPGK